MKNTSEKYAWVGSTIYKWCEKPNARGELVNERIPWSRERIINDYGKDFLKEIPRYDGFCCVPSHIHYQEEIGKFLNEYQPLPHEPATEPGDWSNIEKFLRHVFGEHFEIGLDYIQILLTDPLQMLPVLLLVSREHGTGKTTFLNFMREIFGDNATFNTNEDFRSEFNGDWSDKLMILVDELFLNRKEDSEKLKNLVTKKKHKKQLKCKDKVEVDFFSKFILCTNNEDFPILIEEEENRYFVKKLNRLESEDVGLEEKMRKEIPAFLFELLHRKLSTEDKSRFYFDYALIDTPEGRRMKDSCLPKAEKDLALILAEMFSQNEEADKLQFSLIDAGAWACGLGYKIEKTDIKNILEKKWNVPRDKRGGRTYYFLSVDGRLVKKTGRFYTVTREFFEARFPDM